ncbi:hypothetical protein [Natronolimnobius baerhuensis]|uniref:Uncharacterized protein n=1 Tax=Natronolimnobius baerhuensis TaxID=253108 RepID=A0A202EB75_9EURY|nr:hypothetical protein [Natronolimnobius baerhuensis]OVE85481.1 hypothetical protein B2G88_01255 [Natronolimnobius baerhuensis]
MSVTQPTRMQPQAAGIIVAFFLLLGCLSSVLMGGVFPLIALGFLGAILAIAYILFYLTLAVEELAYDS